MHILRIRLPGLPLGLFMDQHYPLFRFTLYGIYRMPRQAYAEHQLPANQRLADEL